MAEDWQMEGRILKWHMENGVRIIDEIDFTGVSRMTTTTRRTYITTFTGLHFDLMTPTVEMITILDIAHHLSQICRWAGAPKQFWSVAQHSVLVSHIVPPELAKWGLLHDAAEAYLGDITRPLKVLLPQIREIESCVMEVIAAKFQLPFPEPADLSQYDDQMQRFESESIMQLHDGGFIDRVGDACEIANLTHHQRRSIPVRLFAPMNQQMAEITFALRFRELFGAAFSC